MIPLAATGAALVALTPLLLAFAAWTSWNWNWTVEAYPVTGGVLWGEAADSFWTGSELLWQIEGATFAPTSYDIYTYVDGEDRCYSTDPWTVEMSIDHSDYNTTEGQTSAVSGPYIDCSPSANHVYRVFGSHWRQATSSSSFEGSTGYTPS